MQHNAELESIMLLYNRIHCIMDNAEKALSFTYSVSSMDKNPITSAIYNERMIHLSWI